MYLNPFLFECLLFIPSILIYFIIIWILFSSKINKKLFSILFIILFGLFLFYIFDILCPSFVYAGNYTQIPLTQMQIMNRWFAELHIMFNTFPYLSMIIIPLIIVLGIIYYKKTNDKSFLKKSCFISIVITLILYLGFPYSTYDYLPLTVDKSYTFSKCFNLKNKDLIKIHQFAADKAFIKGIKGFLSEEAAMYIDFEIGEKTDMYSKNLSSPEVQKLMDEYVKYQKQYAELLGYDGYINIVQRCDVYKRYDDALKYAYLAKSYGANIDNYIAHLYNQKKEFNKALDIINTGAKVRSNTKIRTYIGLKDYEKALEECNKTDKNYVPMYKYKYKIYIYYKQGKTDLAVKMFEKMIAEYRTKISFDDFIKNADEMF